MNRSVWINPARTTTLALAAAALAILAALIFSPAGAEAAGKPWGKQNVVHACLKMKGKGKGTLRVVPNRKRCTKMRGWRAMAWSAAPAAGQQGLSGHAGARGPKGDRGEPGPPGTAGAAGQVEQTLIETIETQTTQIQSLTNQVASLSGELTDLEGLVSGLGGDLFDLEGAVAGVCGQVDILTTQANGLLAGIADAGIVSGLLGGLVKLAFNTALPEALNPFQCE